MIFDAENTFYDAKPLTSGKIESDIVKLGPGEAGDPLILFANVSKASNSGTLSIAVQTSEDEQFSSHVTLATYAALSVKAKLPRGNLGYMRLKATSTLTAGLVLDDDILN